MFELPGEAAEARGGQISARAVPRVLRLLRQIAATRRRLRGQTMAPREAALELGSVCASVLATQGIELRVRGPIPEGPVIVVANHLSYLDPLVVAAKIPCTAIAKSEVAGWPLLGRAIERLGVIFVRRGDPGQGAVTLRRALRALRGGATVLNFPEGSTTLGTGELLPFRRGIFGVARIAGVPVVPAALVAEDPGLAWVGETPFVAHYLRTVSRRHARLELRLAPAIDPARFASPESLACEAEAAVRRLLAGAGQARVDLSPPIVAAAAE